MRDGLHTSNDGSKFWYLDGKRHREDGPAMEWSDGTKYWYLNGKCHRTDGPAVEYAGGDKAWWLNHQRLSFNQWLEANPEMSDQQRVMFKLEWT
jgi:hypothetical protein